MNLSEYNHQYYIKNQERIRKKQKMKYTNLAWKNKTYQKHRDWYNNLPRVEKEKLLANMRRNGDRIRKNTKIQVMKLCGNQKVACVICGIDDIDVLTIDHKNGRMGNARKSRDKNLEHYGYSLWLKILKGKLPKSEFQTLCMNCNWKRHLNKIRNVSVSQ